MHTIGVGGTLMVTGGGLAWFGLTNIWEAVDSPSYHFGADDDKNSP